ncbi:MAG: cobyrinate a,c-diamide synthase [Desulfobacteraceae bacterium]|jgi:cobyrinic acid a,c-diamide synthase
MPKGSPRKPKARSLKQDAAVPVLTVAGTHSGSGKTTVALGFMAALARRGIAVQGYKVGPDFIDPGHHRAVTGRASHNLDGWMMDRASNHALFTRGLQGAGAAVVEGVMGLFDGFSGNDESGSTAQMAKWLGTPVLLVVDARSMARSAAAVALGFSRFDAHLPLAGVVFNRVASQGHARMLTEAMGSVPDVMLLGCLPREEGLEIPSRHLGLVTAEDLHPSEDRSNRLALWIESHLDLDRILEKAPRIPPARPETGLPGGHSVRIGIARDEAFCFYYEENLRLLKAAGAELIPFSPLRSADLPEGVTGLYLGGGYPELHCETLSANRSLKKEIRAFSQSGRPVYAECGGFMYLMKAIRDLQGRKHRMAGVFPVEATMEPRLRSLGYREITTNRESLLGPAGTKIRGHEFHYSRMEPCEETPMESVYRVTPRNGQDGIEAGFSINGVLGSYVHLHWGSNPAAAEAFVAACARYEILS